MAPLLDLRPYQESDEAAVVALWKAVFAYAAPHNDPLTIIRHKLAVQRELFFVALNEGRLVGTVMGGYDGHRGWIYALAVNSAVRHQGIGTVLVQHAEQALQRLGCFKINLQVVASNAGVVRFYEKLGYTTEERVSLGKLLPRVAAH